MSYNLHTINVLIWGNVIQLYAFWQMYSFVIIPRIKNKYFHHMKNFPHVAFPSIPPHHYRGNCYLELWHHRFILSLLKLQTFGITVFKIFNYTAISRNSSFLVVGVVHWMFVFPPNSYFEALNLSVAIFGDVVFKEIIRLSEVIRVGPWSNRISVLIRRSTRQRPSEHTARCWPPSSLEKRSQKTVWPAPWSWTSQAPEL